MDGMFPRGSDSRTEAHRTADGETILLIYPENGAQVSEAALGNAVRKGDDGSESDDPFSCWENEAHAASHADALEVALAFESAQAC